MYFVSQSILYQMFDLCIICNTLYHCIQIVCFAYLTPIYAFFKSFLNLFLRPRINFQTIAFTLMNNIFLHGTEDFCKVLEN